jgi:tRNA (adenine22-N1)-methyltransferase
LQPQSDVDSVRRFLHEHDFCITEENMVIDGGKYYVMMRAVHGKDAAYDEVDDLYGKLLMEAHHPVLKACLEKEAAVMEQIMQNLSQQATEKSEKRLAEMKRSCQLVSEALKRIHSYHT